MRIRNGFEEFICLRSNLSSDNIISSYRPGVKTGMDFKGLVWKRVLKITLFGLKSGRYLENWAAHPPPRIPRSTPPVSSRLTNIKTNVISHTFIIIHVCKLPRYWCESDISIFYLFIQLISYIYYFSFFFFLTVEALVSNLLGNSKKSWSLARMSSRKRYKTMEGGLLQELTRASETYQ